MAHIEIVIQRRKRSADARGSRVTQELDALYEDLFARAWAALLLVRAQTHDGEWQEAKHPRAPDGRFGAKAGEHITHHGLEPVQRPGPADLKEKTTKGKLHELLASGHEWSKQELMEIAGITNEKTFASWLSMFKKPELSGGRKALVIVKTKDGKYRVAFPDGTPAPPKPTPVPPVAETPKPGPAPSPAPAPGGLKAFPFEWKEAKTTKEATARAVADGWVDEADFGSMTPDNANAIMGSVASHFNEFPELRTEAKHWYAGTNSGYKKHVVAVQSEAVVKRMREQGRSEEDIARNLKYWVRAPRISNKSWATAWDHPTIKGRAVAFNHSNLTAQGMPAMEATLKRAVESKWHPPGCDTVKSIMDHEMGHQLDYMLKLRKNPEVLALHVEAAKTQAPGEPSTSMSIQQRRNMAHAVSTYAATNVAEFIAEAWAESVNNPHPRPVAKRLAEIVRKEYAAQKHHIQARQQANRAFQGW